MSHVTALPAEDAEQPEKDQELFTAQKPKKKEKADGSIGFRIPKKVAWLLGILIVLVGMGGAGWKLGWFQPAVAWYNRASVEVRVKEDGKFPIEAAKIVLDGKEYVTNSEGRAQVEHIVAGTYTLSVSKEGFVATDMSIIIHRGENSSQTVAIKRVPEKLFTVKGIVQDFVSNRPLPGVQVTLRNKTNTTKADGTYQFDQVVPGQYAVTFSLAGFTEKEVSVTLDKEDVVAQQVSLVPSGQLVFVSNRDGKRYLYAASYDGSSPKAFIDIPQNGEDYGLQASPDGKHYSFVSTRARITDTYGEDLAQLYVVDSDGKNLRKLSDDVERTFTVQWSPNGKWLYASGYTTPKLDKRTYKVFNIDTKQVIDIGEETAEAAFSADGNYLLYHTFTSKERPVTTTATPSIPSTTSATQTISVNQLKLLTLSSGERRLVAERDQYMNDIQFAPDGKTAQYSSFVDGGKHRYSVSLEGDPAEQEIAVPAAQRRHLVPSPSGENSVFVEERDGKKDVYLVDKNQKKETKLTSSGTVNDQFLPQWAANGKYIVYAIKREAENALYIVSMDGGDSKKVTDYYAENQLYGYYQ